MIGLTIVDLALHAASVCRHCRDWGRPVDKTDMEHGTQIRHEIPLPGAKTQECRAEQIWVLIFLIEKRIDRGA